MAAKNYRELIAKAVLIPLAGICIPLLTGLYEHLDFSWNNKLLLVNMLFIFLSFLIWEVNVKMMKRFRNRWYRKDKNAYSDFLRRIMLHILFTFTTAIVSLSLLMYFAGTSNLTILLRSSFGITLFVIIVTCIYEIVY